MTDQPTRITCRPTGSAPYDVVVGTALLDSLPTLAAGSTRVLIVHPAALREAAEATREDLCRHGFDTHTAEVPDGENAKSLPTAESLWARLGEIGVTRDDTVVGFGGGAVTDLAGFVAGTWLRGIRVVHVPTTLLAMVDAAVGGKTGLNTEAGKNLVGAFHQPAGVLCDLTMLDTLPVEDFTAGLAEVVKTGFIDDPVILDLLEVDPTGRADTRELIERSIAVKCEVVSADPKEAGRREILNYGHTLAHAVEKIEGYRWRHGDAVSVGLIFAAALGRHAGRLDDATADRHKNLLESIGLPTSYAKNAWPAVHEAMRLDKKSRGNRLRFVVLDGLARPAILEDPDPRLLTAAYAELAEEPS